MATPITHGLLAAGAVQMLPGRKSLGLWVSAILCSTLPDLDCVGFSLGIRYGDLLGHRGLTHSLLFALLLSAALLLLMVRDVRRFSGRWWRLWVFLFLIGASHGLLDAMTDGGLGVAFFSPFSNARYFLPWRPLRVSPIGLRRFLSPWGAAVIRCEMLWVWLPLAAAAVATTVARRVSRRPSE